MHSWEYEVNDVLRIAYKGQEVLARVAGYVDSLDNRTPLYINLRVSDGQRWGERKVRIQPGQIIEHLPNWYEEQHAKWEASIKAVADAHYARMTPEQRQHLHEETERRRRRSPIEIMIDRATGRE